MYTVRKSLWATAGFCLFFHISTPHTPPPSAIAKLWLKYCFSIPQMAVLPSEIIILPWSGREMRAGLRLAYGTCFFVSEEICCKFSRNKTEVIKMNLTIWVWRCFCQRHPSDYSPFIINDTCKWELEFLPNFTLNVQFLTSSRCTTGNR